ncbi:MAG: B12-binding domain-containing radical SAM protein, partial [Calditrichia bacterium]
GRRQLDYISSTGCFFRCAFCADPFVYNRKWTAIEPQRIGEEIECLSKTYRIDDIDFQDETFFTYRKRVVEIAEQFLRRNLSITWAATMRADQGHRMSDEDFAFCARSGLRRVLIGVESGSQEMIDRIQKDIKLEYVLECAGKCLRHNIAAIFPFIVGFPGESEESVHDTLNMAKKLRAMHPKFDTPIFYFKPYPGSLITQEAEKNGYRQPGSTEEWADFDYVGSSGPWVSKDKYKLVERFKFYNRIGWGENHWYAAPLRRLARWRCRHNFYDFPLEKILMGRIRPVPRLS